MRSNLKSVNTVAESEISTDQPTSQTPIDPQVKPKKTYAPRHFYSSSYKLRILAAYDACQDASERGALLRREGLYSTRLAQWRQQRKQGKLENGGGSGKAGKKARFDHMARENEQLKKKLAQAEAIIDLQKKVSELLGVHILPHKSSE